MEIGRYDGLGLAVPLAPPNRACLTDDKMRTAEVVGKLGENRMPTIFDQPNSEQSNSGTIADGAVIAASGVRLTNTDSGRIYAGVTFSTGGGTLVNALGGVIRLTQFDQSYPYPNIVTGSDGADTVINAGLIRGSISLGGGDDLYVDRDGTEYGVDLGAGEDSFRIEGSEYYWSFSYPEVNGGEGVDRVIFANTGNDVRGDSLTGFEILVLEKGGNISNFSGYQSILLGQDAISPTAFFNFMDCLNPLVDLNLDGHAIILQNSTLNAVTGGEGSDYVEMSFGSVVTKGISLGGGDDGFAIDSNQSPYAPFVSTSVNGGSGIDVLSLNWFTAGDRDYDLSNISGFEKLNVNSWYIVDPATARVSHISGLTDIDIGTRVTLILSDSVNPNGRAGGGYGGGLTLEPGVIINRYAIRDGWWDPGVDVAQGDPAMSTTITNMGTITGDIRFYIGDDLYDGRDGTVGGAVYGNAGNDTLLGGAGSERLIGGFGADILEGNGGVDTLTGGAGSDLFQGTASGINGDTITDFAAGDRIIITDATLANFTFNLSGSTLTYTGGSLTFGSPLDGKLVASAAATGGVELTIVNQFALPGGVLVSNFAVGAGGWTGQDLYPRHVADMNGDGYGDIAGFGHAGVFVSYGSQNGFTDAGLVVSNFGYTQGWASDNQFHRELADLNGDGRADIIGFGVAGTWVSLAQANGSFSAPTLAVTNFGANQGWVSQESFARAVGDVNGDGKADIVGFGVAGAWLSFGKGDGTFEDPTLAVENFGVQQGWTSDNQFHRALADINGDGFDDIVGFGYAGTWAARSNGDGTFTDPYLALESFGKTQGWVSQDAFARQVADVNGDGIADIVGFGLAGTWIGYGQANGTFSPVSRDVGAFSANQGWTSDALYHRELADINNDGLIDIVGFGFAGVYAGINQNDLLI